MVERSADGSAAHSSVRGGPVEDRARAVKHFFPKMGGKRSRGGSPGLAGAEGSLGIPKWYAGSVYAAGGGGWPWGRATGRPRGDMDSPGGGGSGLVTRTHFPSRRAGRELEGVNEPRAHNDTSRDCLLTTPERGTV